MKGGLRAWTLSERHWTEHVLRKLNQWENLAPDYESAEKLLKMGCLLKSSGLELPEADNATTFDSATDRPRDIYKPAIESVAPEIRREAGPTITQRRGQRRKPAKTDQQRWDSSMARAEDLQRRSEAMFEREERILIRFEALLEQADLLLVRLVAREAGLKIDPWRENKATVGTIPTEQPGNPLIPSGSTSSFPKLKREPGPETASQRIRQLEEQIKAMQETIEHLHGQLANMEDVNHKRRELGDRFIAMAKQLEKWRNE